MRKFAWIAGPLLILVALIILFLTINPLAPLGVNAPPVEELTVERTILEEGEIRLLVRAHGSQPMKIAQVLVDEAYWRFEQKPEGPIPRLSTAWVHIPYPWVSGEPHEIRFITNTGLTFDHPIEVAMATPEWSLQRLLSYALLGFYIGVIPVALGLFFYPGLNLLSQTTMNFLMSLTIGLLAFLLFDTLFEGLEMAERAADVFEMQVMVWLIMLGTFILIFFFGRRHGEAPEGMSLAYYLSIGIGWHNLGEGLVVGAAYASGEAALGTFLVIGFTLHNITEGIGIAVPLVNRKVPFSRFVGYALIAGAPAILGVWIGGFSYSPHWAAALFAVGTGAILQVIVELGSYLLRQSAGLKNYGLSPVNLAGLATGVLIMYSTAFLISV